MTVSSNGRQKAHHGDINIGAAAWALEHCIRITGDAYKKGRCLGTHPKPNMNHSLWGSGGEPDIYTFKNYPGDSGAH